MPLNNNEFARMDQGAIELRPQPMRLTWAFANVPTVDAHALECRFAASVRVADTDADRRMFAEVFSGSRASVTSDAIIEHFAGALRSAVTDLAARCRACDVVGGTRSDWIEALRRSADAVAFSCGLELLPPFQLDVQSPTLQRQKLEEIFRARMDDRAAGQLQHLQRAMELLRQFQAMRQSAPDLPAGQLLQRFAPADQGLTLRTLLLASSQQSEAPPLWAVAGSHLARIDPRATPPRVELIELPTTLGPLRSVQGGLVDGRRVLLVGARSGVMVVSAQDPQQAEVYEYLSLNSELGFNRVVCSATQIWASHGQAGIVGWTIGERGAPAVVHVEGAAQAGPPDIASTVSSSRLAGPASGQHAGPRHLQLLDDSHLIYAVGNELILRNPSARTALPAQSRSRIIAIAATFGMIVAVHEDGTIVTIDRTTRQVAEARRRGARLAAAAVMPWLGDFRLLLAQADGPIDCIGLDDPLVTQYLSAHRGLKMVTAAQDMLAAVSPDRQRLVLWHCWEGAKPAAEVHLAGMARHRIAHAVFEA